MEITRAASARVGNSAPGIQKQMILPPTEQRKMKRFSAGKYWSEDSAGMGRALQWKGEGCLWGMG